VGLAGRISEAARALGLAADPTAVQAVDLAIDTLDAGAVQPFWRTVLAHDTNDEASSSIRTAGGHRSGSSR
jgi:4a-hydroxytetrahydrobiopterin dehydratase